MKLMITGALGHIGSRLIRDLPTGMFQNVLLLDNLSTQRYPSLFNLPKGIPFRFIEGDILTANLEEYFNDVDVVIHLAAITNASDSFTNWEQVERVNFGGTQRVAQACATSGSALLFISTTSVYGTQREFVDEDCPVTDLKPQSPYAESKLKAEEYLQAFDETAGLRFVICRFGTIFGTSIGMRFHTAINKFCWQAVMGHPLTVWKTALYQKRPYLSLSDAIRAMIFIIAGEIFDRSIYNIVTENHTVHDIIQFIEEHIPQINIESVDSEIMNQLSYEVSNQRFKNKGFKFEGSIRHDITETIQLLRRAGGWD
jgi:UDP-glucose 4-epimerase